MRLLNVASTKSGLGQFGIDNLLRPKAEQLDRSSPIELDKIEEPPKSVAIKPRAVDTTIKQRNIKLSDKTFRRLRLLAIDEDKPISELCEAILSDHLPKISIRKTA